MGRGDVGGEGGLSEEEEKGDGMMVCLRYRGNRIGGGAGAGDPTKLGST